MCEHINEYSTFRPLFDDTAAKSYQYWSCPLFSLFCPHSFSLPKNNLVWLPGELLKEVKCISSSDRIYTEVFQWCNRCDNASGHFIWNTRTPLCISKYSFIYSINALMTLFKYQTLIAQYENTVYHVIMQEHKVREVTTCPLKKNCWQLDFTVTALTNS